MSLLDELKPRTENEPAKQAAALNPRAIWGNALTYLRENREIALHVSCTSDVVPSLNESGFCLEVTTEFSYELIIDEESQKSLKKALAAAKYFGPLQIKRKSQQKSQKELDFERIQFLAGDKLVIK